MLREFPSGSGKTLPTNLYWLRNLAFLNTNLNLYSSVSPIRFKLLLVRVLPQLLVLWDRARLKYDQAGRRVAVYMLVQEVVPVTSIK